MRALDLGHSVIRTWVVAIAAATTLSLITVPASVAATTDVELTTIVDGSPVAGGSTIDESKTVTIGTSALLSPGLSERTLQTTLETATPYVAGSAVAPEGWTIEYSTDGTSWTGVEPSASTVRAVRARATAAAGLVGGQSQVYSTETNASIPASNFAASSGGDGWDTFFSDEKVFNIFHHNDYLKLDCFIRATGQRCTTTDSSKAYPRQFDGYRGVGMPSGFVDPVTGRLYAITSGQVSVNGSNVERAGALCINVSTAAGPDSCGFTVLSDTNVPASWVYTSMSAVLGRKIFAANAFSKELLCFDAATEAPCANTPISLSDISDTADGNGGNAAFNRFVADGTRVWLKTKTKIHCYTASVVACSQSFPVTVNANSTHPLALHTTSTGTPDGVCFFSTAATDPHKSSCVGLSGSIVSTWYSPFNRQDGSTAEADGNPENWWFDGVTAGGRYYWAGDSMEIITCYDWATNAACTNFTKPNYAANTQWSLSDRRLGLVYAVRMDPQNAGCLWINSDAGLIRTFDAKTGLPGCTNSPVITLQPSQFAPRYACSTTAGIDQWTTLRLVSLAGGGSAETVTLTVRDNLNNVVSGWQNVPVTLGQSLDMTGLSVVASSSRPTFSFAFSGVSGSLTTATIALDYKGAGPELCIQTTLNAAAATLTAGCPTVSYLGSLTDSGGTSSTTRSLKIATSGGACTQSLVVETTPGAVTNLTGSGLNTSATLRWRPPTNTGGLPILGYQVSINNGGSWVDANAIDNGDGSYSSALSGLTAGTTYAIQVAAVNGMGRGTAATISITAQLVSINALVDVTLNTGTVGLAPTTGVGLPLTYTASPSSVCTVTGTTVTLVGVGTCSLVADQAGDPNANPIILPAQTPGSFQVLPNPAVAPSVVETLTATPGNQQITLTWNAPSNNGGSAITDYQVQYKSGASWIPFVDGVSASTGAVIVGLTNGQAYDLRVAAVNVAGQGAWTNTITSTPRTVPGAVTSLTVSRSTGATSASLSFVAPGSIGGAALSDYAVEIKERSSSTWTSYSDGTSTGTSITVSGLDSAKEYDFRVAAVNGAGAGAWTSTATLSAQSGAASLTLSWTAPTFTGGETLSFYLIEYRVDGTAPWTPGDTTTATTATLSGLTNGTAYNVRIAAVTSQSTSSYSSVVTETPVDVPGGAAQITVTPGNRQLEVSWPVPIDNGGSVITDYAISYRAVGAQSWTTLADGVSTLRTAVITGLTNGTAYEVRVAAVNAKGTGGLTTSGQVTPRTTPDAPASRQAVGGYLQVAVTWTAPSGDGGSPVTGYVVQYKRVVDVNWTSVTGLTSTSTTLTALAAGTDYSVRVAAVNAAGVGSYTSSVSARTQNPCDTGVLTFAGQGARRAGVNIQDPTICHQRTATLGLDAQGQALGAVLLIPANAVASTTVIDIEVTADATRLAAGLPAVRVTAVDSATSQAVTTFSEPIEIELAGDASAIPAISIDGGVTWRNLQPRTSAEVKALGASGDGYQAQNGTFTIYTMHLTEFALVGSSSGSGNSGSSPSAVGVAPLLPQGPVTIQGPDSSGALTCVSPSWSDRPDSLTYTWDGITAPVTQTQTESVTVRVGSQKPGVVECEIFARAGNAVATTTGAVDLTPVAVAPRTVPTTVKKQARLRFMGKAETLSKRHLRTLAKIATWAPPTVRVVASAVGEGREAKAVAQQRVRMVRAELAARGFTGQIRTSIRLGKPVVVLRFRR